MALGYAKAIVGHEPRAWQLLIINEISAIIPDIDTVRERFWGPHHPLA